MAIIEVSNLTKRYGERIVVEDVTFAVEPGEIFGVIGRNGAGKTTTVECISGLRTPDSGTIRVLGNDPQHDPAPLRRLVGVQLQESALQDKITVREAVDLFASFYPDPARPAQLIDELGLAASAKTQYAKLSGGQKQRLSIALALVGNPKIAILDELTTGLDPQARRDTWQLISQVRDRGVTILLVTHFMDEAERLCDRIAVIHGGRVAALDTPANLTAQVAAGQVLRFRTSSPADLAALRSLPSVTSVEDQDQELTVAGTQEALPQVITELSRQQLVPLNLRVDQANLDDAFIVLTGERA
ncbi:ABC transporter ATP-binding protein [Rhizocola hellebori]|nr:ABC transporter ATP-binding protein [Rhizocola hellebori]